MTLGPLDQIVWIWGLESLLIQALAAPCLCPDTPTAVGSACRVQLLSLSSWGGPTLSREAVAQGPIPGAQNQGHRRGE